MKHGDFTELAKDYVNRPGYSRDVLKMIGRSIGMDRRDFFVADVGAGTGKLTEELVRLGMIGCAVEPNDAMREEGIKAVTKNFVWSKGFAENTNLPSDNFDWVLMGSSFHWANTQEALTEFHRILKPGGYFTAIWNTREIDGHELHERIENFINESIPNMKRVSSANKNHVKNLDMESKLLSTKYFGNIVFTEAPHSITMSKERYMSIWRSVNDIQVQAGEELFKKILKKISEMIQPYDKITVYYRSRAWTVQSL